ncbi:unnamed protein product [Phytomonas sp. EM1]|nr:unnamed protein product [Phytomonas sp. EM1]|eukprot:CCW64005.1 unnamed protein product [Phytomonas sp. isolate EM1]
MDSKTRPSDQTMSNNKADMNREVNVITDETCSFEGDIAETLFRAVNDASESIPENTANGYHEKNSNSTPAIKYDGNLNELPIQGLMDDRGMHDAQESREMKVVVDMDNLGESSRPQSPVRHRKNRSTRPIGDLLDTREANGNLSSTHSLLPLQSLDELGRRPGTAGDQACSGIQINEMISMEEDIKKPIELVVDSSKIPFQPATKAPTPFSQKLVITSTPEPLESDLPSMRYPAPASLPVTLLGVSTDLRRKRIKKVSNYIIGALLGEGTYGVVRDGLDISGERILRCAVKMCNVSSGSTTGAKERPALKRTDHAAYLRQVTRRETANLQRFHSPYIVRAHDIFTMNGKEYIIFPIAICSLEQLVQYARQGASAKPPATLPEAAPVGAPPPPPRRTMG